MTAWYKESPARVRADRPARGECMRQRRRHPSPTPVPTDVPTEVLTNEGEWPLANRSYNQTRAVADSRSTRRASARSGWPGRVRSSASGNTVRRLPGRSSPAAWSTSRTLRATSTRSGFPTGPRSGAPNSTSRHSARTGRPSGYGKLFVQVPPDRVVALNLATGEEDWSVALGYPVGANQPIVYDGQVYVRTMSGVQDDDSALQLRGYAAGASGHMLALNAETGATTWDVMTVAADFWGRPDVNSGGSIWYPPAVDRESGQTFWGTGHGALPGTAEFPNGTSRPGPNPDTNSVLSLDHATGSGEWKTRVANDIFSQDVQAPPILATVKINDTDREIVIGSGTLGRIVAFDRATGEILLGRRSR